MTAGLITIKEALQIMNTGKPFAIAVATYDKRRNTGGDRNKYIDATFLHVGSAAPKNEGTAVRNPNHGSHSTLNIRTKSGDIQAIHIPLIESLNGQRITL